MQHKAYADITRRKTARAATTLGLVGWTVVVICWTAGRHISPARIPGLVIDLVVTFGVTAFIAAAVSDTFKQFRRGR